MPRSGGPPQLSDLETFIERFGVSRETAGRLETYAETLRQWQRAINLVAPGTLPQLWDRHFADSAQLAALVPGEARSLADLGSGAGFPGLVLAIMLMRQPGVAGDSGPQGLTRVILVESDSRKSAFLRDVARSTATPVEILSTRIENRETQASIGKVDVVTARALAPLDKLLGWSIGLFGDGTVGLFPKGRDAALEVESAKKLFDFDVSLVPSLTHPQAQVVMVRHLQPRAAPAGRVRE